MPNSGYSTTRTARPKVGRKDPLHELYVMDMEYNRVHKVDISALPGVLDKPLFMGTDSLGKRLKYAIPKAVIYNQVKMDKAGESALIEIKSYDNKDRWICLYSIGSDVLKCLDYQHDEAWIGGPGISGWTTEPGNIGWMDNERAIYFVSEKTGYSHLYQHVLKTRKKRALTEGNFEIYKAELSQNDTKFHITANKTHPGNRGFYHLNTKPIKWTPIFEKDGNYDVVVSPNEYYLAFRYSYKNKPWELYYSRNIPKAKITQITNSTNETFNSYEWREPEVITFKNQKKKLSMHDYLDQNQTRETVRPYNLYMVPVIFKMHIIGGVHIIVNTCFITYSVI